MPAKDTERRIAVERLLIRIRWFGIALAAWQVAEYRPLNGGPIPPWVHPTGLSLLALFAAANLALAVFIRRGLPPPAIQRLSIVAFGIDLVLLWSLVWIYSFEDLGSTWIILLIAPLAGATRYQWRGAVVPVVLALLIEPLRETYRLTVFGFDFYPRSLGFRIGMMALIAAGVGAMSSKLEREREQAQQLAVREAALYGELQAFHDVLLAGISVSPPEDGLQSMVERIARDFGYTSLTVLLRREDGALTPVASHGLPEELRTASLPPGMGLAGACLASGRAIVTPDVSLDARYVGAVPDTRSECDVPIFVGGQAVGVLTAERDRPYAFDDSDAVRLERLAAYMTLVIENARLLAQERATVERLRELDTMKSDFVAITSHELRTPLTAMRGFIKTLRRPDLETSKEELDEFLAILDRQSDRLARLVEDLLVVSRIDAGALHLRMERVRVDEVLGEMLYELGVRRGRVRLVVDKDLPEVVIDGQRLGQIARNLVENALKFSAADTSVRLTALCDGGRLVVEVADRGPGIAPQDLERIFDRFQQIGGSLRRRTDGFGLGLYITKRLVEALGGTIEVESEPGRGTTFRARLPLAVADDAAADTA